MASRDATEGIAPQPSNDEGGLLVPAARGKSAVWAAFLCCVPALLGVALALVASLVVVFPFIGTGSADQDRKIELGNALRQGLLDSSDGRAVVAFLGDSVTVDGIDADVVEKNAETRLRVLNLGIRGCNRTGLDVIVPAVVDAGPEIVVMVLQPDMVIAQFELPEDSAYAYTLAGFPSAWPSGWMNGPPPGIPSELMPAFEAHEFEGRLHFRNAPQSWFNSNLRERLREGVRVAAPDDWVAPFARTVSISGATLDLNIQRVARETIERRGTATEQDRADLARLIHHFSRNGVKLLVVGAPAHPQLRETFAVDRDSLREVVASAAEQSNGQVAYADAFELLDASGFADAIHPNREGREILSAFIGRTLPSVWTATQRN